MATIDVNCDMGEGIGNDELIMRFISSATIACGYHAGDEKTILKTIELAKKYTVSIGAHPSFFDRENFGRVEINLSAADVYELVTQQLLLFNEIAAAADTGMRHIKPHGALYNMSAKDASTAKAIARAVKDVDRQLVLFGLSGSHSISEARHIGLKTASEVFADRTYREDGSLTPRSQPGALIEDNEKAVQQVLQMIKEGTVKTATGKTIPVSAETICIHGDGKQAAALAQKINESLKENHIDIKAI
jgi:5-oxoprolinase (ATP-hydrolysing) subunit A